MTARQYREYVGDLAAAAGWRPIPTTPPTPMYSIDHDEGKPEYKPDDTWEKLLIFDRAGDRIDVFIF